jgi:hypothetical protein
VVHDEVHYDGILLAVGGLPISSGNRAVFLAALNKFREFSSQVLDRRGRSANM